jgi:hypothetical protein
MTSVQRLLKVFLGRTGNDVIPRLSEGPTQERVDQDNGAQGVAEGYWYTLPSLRILKGEWLLSAFRKDGRWCLKTGGF